MCDNVCRDCHWYLMTTACLKNHDMKKGLIGECEHFMSYCKSEKEFLLQQQLTEAKEQNTKLMFEAEEYQCLSLVLDGLNVPRSDGNNPLSLVGRVDRYIHHEKSRLTEKANAYDNLVVTAEKQLTEAKEDVEGVKKRLIIQQVANTKLLEDREELREKYNDESEMLEKEEQENRRLLEGIETLREEIVTEIKRMKAKGHPSIGKIGVVSRIDRLLSEQAFKEKDDE